MTKQEREEIATKLKAKLILDLDESYSIPDNKIPIERPHPDCINDRLWQEIRSTSFYHMAVYKLDNYIYRIRDFHDSIIRGRVDESLIIISADTGRYLNCFRTYPAIPSPGYIGKSPVDEAVERIKKEIELDLQHIERTKKRKELRKQLSQPFQFVPNPNTFRQVSFGVGGWIPNTITTAIIEGVRSLHNGKLTKDLADPNGRLGFLVDGSYKIASFMEGSFRLLFIDSGFFPIISNGIAPEFNSPHLKVTHMTMADKEFLERLVEAYKHKEEFPMGKNNYHKFLEEEKT